MSVRLSVCQPHSRPQIEISLQFLFVQILLINEHIFCKYFVRLSVVSATKALLLMDVFILVLLHFAIEAARIKGDREWNPKNLLKKFHAITPCAWFNNSQQGLKFVDNLELKTSGYRALVDRLGLLLSYVPFSKKNIQVSYSELFCTISSKV